MSLARRPWFRASRDLSVSGLKSIEWIIFNLFTIVFFMLPAAAHGTEVQDVKTSEPSLLDDKYSLKADLNAFEELRKNIPPERRKENDEKAFMDQMMSDLTNSPAEVRGRFSSIVSKKRDLFNKDMMKARQKFSGEEKKEREKYTKDQSEVRKDFSKRKVTSDERREFFQDLEAKRKEFYLEQKDKRDEFEEEIREKRRNFEDYMRAKVDEFNQLHRDYTKRYDENKKLQADLKRKNEDKKKQFIKDVDQEYDLVRKKDPTILEPAISK